MELYTPKVRAEIFQLYIQNNLKILKTKRAFCSKNNVKSAPSDNTIKSLYATFW
nr:unnamed protein product [Callosobruchus analis]